MHARLLWHRAQRIDSSRLRNSGDSLVGYDMAATRATATDQTGDRSAGCTAAGCTLRITVWLEVRVLPGPPGSPRIGEISWPRANSPELAGFRAAARSLQYLNGISVPVSVLLSLASKSRFPATETVDRVDPVRRTELTQAHTEEKGVNVPGQAEA